LAFLTLYLNKEIGKTNGFFVKDITSNKLSNILKLYTFNIPIVVVLLERDNDSIRIQQDTYVKLLDTTIAKQQYTELSTFIARGSKYFNIHIANNETKQPNNIGLEDNTKCKLRLHTNKEHISKKLTTNINIVFAHFKFDLLKYPIEYGLTIRGINRTIKEKITENDFMDKNNEQIQAIAIKNTVLEKQQKQICFMAKNKR
jgi:hypothetical protein